MPFSWTPIVHEPASPTDLRASSARHNAQVLDNLSFVKDGFDQPFTNVDTSTILANGIAVETATGVVLTTTAGDARPVVVALGGVNASASGDFRTIGRIQVRVTGVVNRGDPLQTSTTAGVAMAGSTNPFAQAIDASAGGTAVINATMAPLKATQGAPLDAKYLTQSANGTLTNEFDLSALGSGLLKQTVASGTATPAVATAGTDYYAPGSAIANADLPTLINATARVGVQKNGTATASRRAINLIEGTGVTITEADNSGSERVDVTITASGGGGATNPWAHALAFR